MPQAISDFVNATSRLRIFEQAETAMEEQLHTAMSKITGRLRNEREQEIIGTDFECEADASKYVEEGVLADMDVVYNTEPYRSFMTRLAKVRNNVWETRGRLSKLDLKFDNIKLEGSP